MNVPLEESISCGSPTAANARLPSLSYSPTDRRPVRPSLRRVPEILRADHFRVVHHFALVGGDLQGRQHVVHSG